MKQGHLKPKGFTLVELLVVIAIIALLSTVGVVSLNSARMKGRDAKRVADVRQIQTALELYNDSVRGYPSVGTTAVNLGENTGTPAAPVGPLTLSKTGGFAPTINGETYMAMVPRDPLGSTTYHYAYIGKNNDSPMTPCLTGPCSRYEISYSLEGTIGGLSGPLCATEAGLAATCTH